MTPKPIVYTKKKGFHFSFNPEFCMQCFGYCCCGESGYIWVNQNEINQISSFLKINIIDFLHDYCTKVNNRYSINEYFSGYDFKCVFFNTEDHNCSIYRVRPKQCREYPFWEFFKEHTDELIKECPGIGKHY